MRYLVLIAVIFSCVLVVNAQEKNKLLEISLLYGDESMSFAGLGAAKIAPRLGAMVSALSLGLPDWKVTTIGIGAGWWTKGFFFGGGMIVPEFCGGFGSIMAWNDSFYMSLLSFHPTFYKSYTRLYVEGAFQEGGLVQGRIEAINNSCFSTVISIDGGIMGRADKLFQGPQCLWIGVGSEAAWRGCYGSSEEHVEVGIRPSLRVDIGNLSTDLLFFYVWSNDGSEAWGVELTFHLSLPHIGYEGTR